MMEIQVLHFVQRLFLLQSVVTFLQTTSPSSQTHPSVINLEPCILESSLQLSRKLPNMAYGKTLIRQWNQSTDVCCLRLFDLSSALVYGVCRRNIWWIHFSRRMYDEGGDNRALRGMCATGTS
jgi:hypothetical protein